MRRKTISKEGSAKAETAFPLKAPFPWFGGKSRVAGIVWERFGNVPRYIEPFAGSLAVLLGRPHAPKYEVVNDIDCMVANFWRALKNDPAGVAEAADWPKNEADLHARHIWLCSREEFRERMKRDPAYYDARIAGWWVWGQCTWIGGGWCGLRLKENETDGRRPRRKKPQVDTRGVFRTRQEDITVYMHRLAERLRSTTVYCGDWSRAVTPSVTYISASRASPAAVFLDPPYSGGAGRDTRIYAEENLDVANQVREWAVANGDNPKLRIALCGYEGEHEMPGTWSCVPWRAIGGYGLRRQGRGRENRTRERIWFSPHCLPGPESGAGEPVTETAAETGEPA